MNSQKGMTLVEVMVASMLMVIVILGMLTLIIQFGSFSRTQDSRVTSMQESRFVLSELSSGLKSSGAVLNLCNTPVMLGVIPYFNGVYPLNNADKPDGIILASGDPYAVTKLSAEFDASSIGSNGTISVESSDATPAWQGGDKGIILSASGYFIFSVNTESPGAVFRLFP